MAEIPGQLEQFLLPFDPSLVANRYGMRLGQLALPGVRCTEDRPRSAFMLRPDGLRVPVLGMPRPEDDQSVDGMFANALRTGLSVTGGVGGVAVARDVSDIMAGGGSGSTVRPSLRELEELMALGMGIGELHKSCVGWEARAAIVRYATDHPEETFSSAIEIAPWVDRSLFGSFVDAGRVALEGSLKEPVSSPKVPLRLLRTEGEGAKVPQHAAKQIVSVGDRTGDHVLWDTVIAWDAGEPAYALNVGFLPEIFEGVFRRRGAAHGDVEKAVAAMIFYQGAAANLLPHPDGEGHKLAIHYVGS